MSHYEQHDINSPDTDPKDFYSTNLNHRIKNISDLSKRIAYNLGWPQINIEVHAEQVFDNIAQACELFTKFAGYTEEYLIFKSTLYKSDTGIRLDKLMTFTPEMSGLVEYLDTETDAMSLGSMGSSTSPGNPFTINTQEKADKGVVEIPAGYDSLLLNHRKVVDVFALEEGSSSGINTLFTIEQTMAQQTYFSYAMGKYGFDLVSWYALKEWLDIRKKMLGQEWHYRFNERTQCLHIIPNPAGRNRSGWYGLIGCYVEKPLVHVLKEQFVFRYALALTKITLGRIRGKYAGTGLFGGGQVNYTELLTEGNTERDTLEQELYSGAAGFGDAGPPKFFVG